MSVYILENGRAEAQPRMRKTFERLPRECDARGERKQFPSIWETGAQNFPIFGMEPQRGGRRSPGAAVIQLTDPFSSEP